MFIGDYSIGGYWCLIMVTSGYSTSGYWCLLISIILMVIGGYSVVSH
jgi:hypothetical protein